MQNVSFVWFLVLSLLLKSAFLIGMLLKRQEHWLVMFLSCFRLGYLKINVDGTGLKDTPQPLMCQKVMRWYPTRQNLLFSPILLVLLDHMQLPDSHCYFQITTVHIRSWFMALVITHYQMASLELLRAMHMVRQLTRLSSAMCLIYQFQSWLMARILILNLFQHTLIK